MNIPPNARGIHWARQSVRQYDGKMVLDEDPMGREHYWFTVVPIQEPEPGTDRWAVDQGWISITPLRLDLTDEGELERLKTVAVAELIQSRENRAVSQPESRKRHA